MKYAAAFIAGGLVLFAYGCARAAEWQVHVFDGTAWVPAKTPKGYTARVVTSTTDCLFDLHDIGNVVPKGTMLQCRKVSK